MRELELKFTLFKFCYMFYVKFHRKIDLRNHSIKALIIFNIDVLLKRKLEVSTTNYELLHIQE